jgi:hypothetical protein
MQAVLLATSLCNIPVQHKNSHVHRAWATQILVQVRRPTWSSPGLCCSALTQHALRRGQPPPQRGQAQVPNLDLAAGAVDKDVIAFEVAVDDGGVVRMQVHQPLQDLPRPAPQHLLINVLVLLAVPAAGWMSQSSSRRGSRSQQRNHGQLLVSMVYGSCSLAGVDMMMRHLLHCLLTLDGTWPAPLLARMGLCNPMCNTKQILTPQPAGETHEGVWATHRPPLALSLTVAACRM